MNFIKNHQEGAPEVTLCQLQLNANMNVFVAGAWLLLASDVRSVTQTRCNCVTHVLYSLHFPLWNQVYSDLWPFHTRITATTAQSRVESKMVRNIKERQRENKSEKVGPK
jgi:hypothetical protein